eukprot:8491739-Alexandrium_andersonii.AAC.1
MPRGHPGLVAFLGGRGCRRRVRRCWSSYAASARRIPSLPLSGGATHPPGDGDDAHPSPQCAGRAEQ